MDPQKYITKMWIEWEITDGRPTWVVVIATTLELNPEAADSDSGITECVIEAARKATCQSGSARVRLVPSEVYDRLG